MQRTDLEPMLFLGREMVRAELCHLPGGKAAVFTVRSPKKERTDLPNEDAAVLIPAGPESSVLLVADGLGGAEAGERAAEIAAATLVAAVQEAGRSGGELRAAILDGLEEANRRVRGLGGQAGTTLVAVAVNRHVFRCYHVGDSIFLVIASDGRLKWRNIPHSPVGYALEAGLMDEEEALHHDHRHVVSNIVGSREMRIEIGPELPLAPDDTLLLASDGLFDNLKLMEIARLARSNGLPEAADHLAAEALRRMLAQGEGGAPSKPDDLTLVAYRPDLPEG